MHVRLLPLAALIGLLASTTGDAREWASKMGNFKVQARLIEATSEKVMLKTAEGREITVPLESLSKADQDYAAAWLRAKDGTPPELPDGAAMLINFKFRTPEGRTGSIPNVGGFAIKVRGQKRAVLLSVVIPFATKELGIDVANMERSVPGADLVDPQSRKVFAKATGVLQLRGSKEPEGDNTANDVTAFWVDAASKVGALTLASESPAKDERVWLLGLPANGDPVDGKGPELLPAKVVEAAEDHNTIELDGAVVPPNSLGAPIVNFAGEVVGMFSFRGGRKGTVVAVRPEDIQSKLIKALK